MAVSSYLKASVCLTILVFLSTSTHADVTSACQNACTGNEGQTAFVACVIKCKEILSYVNQLEVADQIPAENEEEYEDPTDGLSAEEAAQLKLSRPLQFLSRNDRAVRRANLLLNRFVRYGRSQPQSLRKAGQRRPNYLRVGRSDELNGGDFEVEAKRASRFVRIGKADIYEADARDGGLQDVGVSQNQYEVDKKSNKRPSKYVRIGKRED